MVEFAVSHGKPVVVGTSGWSRERISEVEDLINAHPEVGVIFIANFSLGSALATKLATVAAEQCRRLQEYGVHEFHFYTLNRADLVYAICRVLGLGAVAKAA